MRKFTSVALFVLGFVFLWWAGGLHSKLLSERSRSARPELLDASPLLAFTTVALGGFRGVITDILWIRISNLQEEGRYFEIVQLSDWITKLEPQFAAVWGFHAWNLAYNISVMFSEPEDRWRWVQHGIRLLRDEGLQYNPDNTRLYWELGWLFQHKLGAYFDQAHWYYKKVWAQQMSDELGGAHPDYPVLLSDAAAQNKLWRDFKLRPETMRELDAEWGPLDWRMPETHALYWARQGLRRASGFDRASLDRMAAQCLAEMFRKGKLAFDGDGVTYGPEPDWAVLPRALQAAEAAALAYPDQDSFRVGHQNLLREAVVLLHRYGKLDEARVLFAELAARYPSPETENGLDVFLEAAPNASARP